tara:strand:+ start:190 stop:684 length:495 start_codon:yes stop_codon:yes gene_type:complete
MIEKGFDKNTEKSSDDIFRYDKSAMDKLIASAAFRSLDSLSSAAITLFMFPEDFIGKNDNYDNIFDTVKKDCEFKEVREFGGNEVAFYNCPETNNSLELIELEKLYKKMVDKPLTKLDSEIGFVKNGSLFIIYYPINDLYTRTYVQMIKGILELLETKKDSIQK